MEAERRGFRKIVFLIDFERAQESLREITNLIDRGLVYVSPIEASTVWDLPFKVNLIAAIESARWQIFVLRIAQ
jgi:hypothetical protein